MELHRRSQFSIEGPLLANAHLRARARNCIFFEGETTKKTKKKEEDISRSYPVQRQFAIWREHFGGGYEEKAEGSTDLDVKKQCQ